MWWHAISDSDDTREPIFGGAAGARGVTINFWLLLCFDIRGKHVAMSMTRTMTTMIAAQRQFIIIVYSARWKCLRETFFFFFFYYHSFTLSAQAITNKRFRAHLCVQTRTTDTGFFFGCFELCKHEQITWFSKYAYYLRFRNASTQSRIIHIFRFLSSF